MPDSDGSESSRRGGSATALWVCAGVLAAAATGVLIISDDARLLRLGLVAALWAALIGAFAVAKLRGRVAADEDRAAELQRVYELELEREVAARREFEVEAELEARRRVEEESDRELQALRAELNVLRQNLEQILGGDVLFERVALRAESTRVRSLADQVDTAGRAQGALGADSRARELPPDHRGNLGTGGFPGAAVANPVGAAADAGAVGGGNAGGAERKTEMFERVTGEQPLPKRPPRRPASRSGPGQAPAEPVKTSVVRGAPVARPNAGGEWGAPAASESSQERAPGAGSRTRADSSGSAQPAEQPAGPRAEAGEPDAQPQSAESPQFVAGAHTEGTSVVELLAAYGDSKEAARTRRRRN